MLRATTLDRLEEILKFCIDQLNEVVSSLIDAVDCPLGHANPFRGEVVTPRNILFMPEIKICRMIAFDQAHHAVRKDSWLILVPMHAERSVSLDDVFAVV